MLSYPGCHVRATYIGCIEIHARGRQCYAEVTPSCEIASQRIQGLWKLILE